MPNHVINILSFEGDKTKIRQMLEDIKDDECGLHSVDFNKIIPMPPSLDLEASSRTQAGLAAYKDFIDVYTLGGTINTEHLSDIPVASEQRFLKVRTDIRREDFALGKQAWNNLRQYGAATWYECYAKLYINTHTTSVLRIGECCSKRLFQVSIPLDEYPSAAEGKRPHFYEECSPDRPDGSFRRGCRPQ